MEQIDTMTWRFFLALVNNLSPWGAAAMRMQDNEDKPEPDEQTDKQAADAFFARVVSV